MGELARLAAMSPSHFAHRFRAVARTSPMRYLRVVRLDAARARLFTANRRVALRPANPAVEGAAGAGDEILRRAENPLVRRLPRAPALDPI